MKHLILFLIVVFTIFTVNAQNELLPYRKGTNWGYANLEGKIIVTPQFNSVNFFFQNKYTTVSSLKNDTLLKGLIRNDGKIIITPKYKAIEPISNSSSYSDHNNNDAYQAYQKKNKYLKLVDHYFITYQDKKNTVAFVDSNGNELLKNVEKITISNYYDKGFFNFFFYKNDKVGFANYKGEVILSPIYDALEYVKRSNHTDFIKAIFNNQQCLITQNGKTIIPYTKNNYISEYYQYDNNEEKIKGTLFEVSVNDKKAVYDENGKLIVPYTSKKFKVFPQTVDGKQVLHYIFEENNEMISQDYESTADASPPPPYDYAEKAPAEIKIDPFDVTIQKQQALFNRKVNGKYYCIFNNNKKMGLLQLPDSIVVIKPIYDSIAWLALNYEYNKNPFIQVYKNNLVGIFNINNETIIPIKYQQIVSSSFTYDNPDINFIVVKNKKNNVGVINTNNEIIVPFNYASIKLSHNLMIDTTYIFEVKNNKGLLGVYHSKQKILIAENFKELNYLGTYTFTNTKPPKYIYCAKNEANQYGFISFNNDTIIDLIYDTISIVPNYFKKYNTNNNFENFLIEIKKENKFGLLDGLNNTLIAPLYDSKIDFIDITKYNYNLLATTTLNGNNILLNINNGNATTYNNNYQILHNGYNNTAGFVLFKNKLQSNNNLGVLIPKTLEFIKPIYNDYQWLSFSDLLGKSEYDKSYNYGKRILVLTKKLDDKLRSFDIITSDGLKFFED